jgi:hypothetical protein
MNELFPKYTCHEAKEPHEANRIEALVPNWQDLARVIGMGDGST